MTRTWVIAAGAALLLAGGAQAAPLAFPEAQGYGANAKGGRGGIVCQVTTLADSGAGSLRACLDQSGPRTVVFRVGGTITLSSQINVRNGYVTIAGQTAPGGGIQIRGSTSHVGDVLRLAETTQHVIIRHLRLRRGAGASSGRSPIEGDPLEIRGQYVIADHLSLAWGNDQVVSTSTGAANITIQNSIVAEGLYRSTNPEGPHSMGPLLYKVNNITLYRNVMAHNQERNPRINNSGITDLVNNVIYNPGSTPSVITSDWGSVKVNYVGNYYKKGRNSPSSSYAVTCSPTKNPIEVYQSGNLLPNGASEPVQQATCRAAARHPAPSITAQAAATAYDAALATAGAFPRDAADQRIVADVRNGAGGIIDNPSQVGGWPTIAGGTPYPDSDRDGMDDGWELDQGLSASNAADRNGDPDGDGYTNLEEFLAARAADLLN